MRSPLWISFARAVGPESAVRFLQKPFPKDSRMIIKIIIIIVRER